MRKQSPRRALLPLLAVLATAVAAALLTAGPAAASGNYTCPPNTGADVQTGISDGGTVYIHGTCHGNFFIDANNALNVTLIGLGTNPTLNGDGNGPVLSITGPANVTIKNLTLTNGNAEVGGGIYASFGCDEQDDICGSPEITVIGSKITGNTAFAGGGIFTDDCTDVTLTNTTVSNNTATDGDGGGEEIYGCGFLTVNGATFSKNTASTDGGGLAVYFAQASVNSSTFSNNTATFANELAGGDGGGIDAEFSDLQVTNSRLLSNWAYGSGGAIDFGDSQGCAEAPSSSSAAMAAAHHHATRSAAPQQPCIGGPTKQPNQPEIPAGLTVSSTTIDHNTAATFGGGGIENYAFAGDSPATISNSTISNNIAPGNDPDGDSGGGGIHQVSCENNASLTITGSKIYGNTALSSLGGGISNISLCDGGADVSLGNTLLQNPNSLSPGNQAKYGGGIYNGGNEVATLSIAAQSRLYRNKATGTGGGVYNDCLASLTVSPGALLLQNTPNNIFNSTGCLIVEDD